MRLEFLKDNDFGQVKKRFYNNESPAIMIPRSQIWRVSPYITSDAIRLAVAV